MPDGAWSFAFDGQHAQQSKPALELEDQIVAWDKNISHGFVRIVPDL